MAREDTATAPALGRTSRTLPGFTEQLIEPLSRLRSEVDRLFDDFPFRLPALRMIGRAALAEPALEMTETPTSYKITAELPGMDPGAVEVSIDGNILRIAGEKREERDEDEQGYHMSERSYGAFQRAISLPDGIDVEKIKATCRNGVLTVAVPKDEKAASSARKIAVELA